MCCQTGHRIGADCRACEPFGHWYVHPEDVAYPKPRVIEILDVEIVEG